MKPLHTILLLLLFTGTVFGQSYSKETRDKFATKQDASANLTNWSNIGTNQFLGTNVLPNLTNQFQVTNANLTQWSNIGTNQFLGTNVNVLTNNQTGITLSGVFTNGTFYGNGGGLTNVTGTGGATNAIANLNGFGTNTTLITYLTNAPTYITNTTNFGSSSYFTNATYVTNFTSATNVTASNNTNLIFASSAGSSAINGQYIYAGISGNSPYWTNTSGYAQCFHDLTNSLGNGSKEGYLMTNRLNMTGAQIMYATLLTNTFPNGAWTNYFAFTNFFFGALPPPTALYGTNYTTNYVLETIVRNIITNFSPANGGTFIGALTGNGGGLTNLAYTNIANIPAFQPANVNLTNLASLNGLGLTNLPFVKTLTSTNLSFTPTVNADGSTNMAITLTNLAGLSGGSSGQPPSANLTNWSGVATNDAIGGITKDITWIITGQAYHLYVTNGLIRRSIP